MAITQDNLNGDGSNLGPFSFTFKWLKASDIKVSVGGALKTAGVHYNLQALNYTTKTGGQVLFTAGNAPAVGTGNIRVYRETDDSALIATFSSGSAIRSQDLNDNNTQVLYRAQEVGNYSVQDTGTQTLTGQYTFLNPITIPAAVNNTHAVTKQYVDSLAFSSTGISDGNKGDITLSSSGTVWTIGTGVVSTAKLAASAVTDTQLATDAVTTTKILNGAVTAAKLADTYLTTASATSTYLAKSGGTMTGAITFNTGQAYPQIPANSQVSAYTLVVGDAGKYISITTGGVTVPSGVFAAGDAISIYNNSGSNQTITQGGSVTLRQAGTANTGNRTLAQYGLATVLCVGTNTFTISGAGLT
jgi:hypothetical protein